MLTKIKFAVSCRDISKIDDLGLYDEGSCLRIETDLENIIFCFDSSNFYNKFLNQIKNIV